MGSQLYNYKPTWWQHNCINNGHKVPGLYSQHPRSLGNTTTMAISHISAEALSPCKCFSVVGIYVTAAAAVAVLTLGPWSGDTR
jgi:hypothetical protein